MRDSSMLMLKLAEEHMHYVNLFNLLYLFISSYVYVNKLPLQHASQRHIFHSSLNDSIYHFITTSVQGNQWYYYSCHSVLSPQDDISPDWTLIRARTRGLSMVQLQILPEPLQASEPALRGFSLLPSPTLEECPGLARP